MALVLTLAGCDCDDDDSGEGPTPTDDDAGDDDLADGDADDDSDDDTAPDDDTALDDDLDDIDADLAIDVGQIVDLLNRRLNGGHYHDERPTEAELSIGPTFRRRVASAGNHMHWDCDTQSFSPETLTEYHDWLDVLQSEGLEPMISLSYVPECIARFDFPKAPPLASKAQEYDLYIRSFFQEFVSGRIADGKEPLRYFEVWNEPEPPIPQPAGNGNGFFGLLDVFTDRIFIPLGRAVMDEEEASGVDIKLGVAAVAVPREMRHYFSDLEEFLLVAGFSQDWAAFLGSLGESLADIFYPLGGFDGFWDGGGFDWPDGLIATGEAEGIDVDFVSYHHYIDFPFEGPGEGCAVPEVVWFMHQRNSRGNVAEYFIDSVDYQERYPDQEIYLTEWGISYGCQDRDPYEIGAFHAATLVALQQSGMDGAMALYLPGEGPEAIAHWMFVNMADNVVAQQLNEDSAETGVWTLASVDQETPETLTLLVAQWHSLLEDAVSRELDVGVVGLEPGEYDVALYMIDATHDGAMEPDVVDVLTVADESPTHINVPLDGLAASFVEVSRAQ